ncbi:MAG: hypothetical protein RL417_2168 [Pseudomonadota bacterium]|jgi:lactate dehydrogenase-like 2-hydroxyacid dehydrogenase
MKAFIFDPIWNELITPELSLKLSSVGIEPVVEAEIRPLSGCAELFQGDTPRLLAVNPDYVGWKLRGDDYKDVPSLKGIFGAATSYSWIDTSVATQRDIPVCNIRNFSTEAVAEWAIMMMLNLARQTPRLIRDGFPLDFDRDFMSYRGIEVRGKTAAILGLGNIGNAIAERCHGLGMNVIYWSRSSKISSFSKVELPQLFQSADVLFPTFSDNPDSRGIISEELVMSLKPSSMIVSVVHGLINEPLVLDMVKRGTLFGYGFEAKPATFDAYQGNVWAAPAYAWATDGSMRNTVASLVENMVYAAQGLFPHRVN